MKRNRLSAREWGERVVLALLFVAIGSFIMVVFNPWGHGPLLNRVDDYLAKIGVSILLLVVALLARNSTRCEKYWQVLFAFFYPDRGGLLGIYIRYISDQIPGCDRCHSGWLGSTKVERMLRGRKCDRHL